jgi:hypothetical protein
MAGCSCTGWQQWTIFAGRIGLHRVAELNITSKKPHPSSDKNGRSAGPSVIYNSDHCTDFTSFMKHPYPGRIGVYIRSDNRFSDMCLNHRVSTSCACLSVQFLNGIVDTIVYECGGVSKISSPSVPLNLFRGLKASAPSAPSLLGSCFPTQSEHG